MKFGPIIIQTNNTPTQQQVAMGQAMMYCKNCRYPMVRGTQCPRCKAWCR